MRESRAIMGMPINLDIVHAHAAELGEIVFSYLDLVDKRFSTYKDDSEISRINHGRLAEEKWSGEMCEVLALAEHTRHETHGYFNIRRPDGLLDPSGVVKGWAIRTAAHILACAGVRDFYINAGGDIASRGASDMGAPWSVGIRSPFKHDEVVKVIYPRGKGVATSGTYRRGQHIYNPHEPERPITDIVSLTVVGPDVCEADRFATAAFAMGRRGIDFIEQLEGFEGYLIDRAGTATLTSGFAHYTTP